MGYVATANIQLALDTQLQTVAGLPTFYQENQAATSQNINAFCRSTLAAAKSTIIGSGINPVVQQTGLYQVDLFYPVGYGYSAARNMADAVIAAFPPGFILLSDGVTQLTILTAWSQGGVATRNDSAFWQIPIRIEWIVRTSV